MWVIAVISGLVIFAVLVFLVPLDIKLKLNVRGRFESQIELGWFFGLVRREIIRGKETAGKEKGVAPSKRRRGWSRTDIRTIFDVVRTKGLVREVTRFMRRVISSLKIREFGADFRVGLGDPADTGLLFALLGPLTALLNSLLADRIRFQPSFDEGTVIEGNLYGTFRMWPVRLVPPFIGFVFSSATRRAVKTLVLARWKRR